MRSDPIAIIERTPTPYRTAIFNEVGKRRNTTVYYYFSDESKGRWSSESVGGGESFDEQKLLSLHIGPFVIMPTLPYYLLQGGFKEVVGTSDTNVILTMILTLPLCLVSNLKLTIWTEEIDTEYRYSRYKKQSFTKRLFVIVFWKVTRIGQQILYRAADQVIAYSGLARETALDRGASDSKIVTRPQAIDPAILSTADPDFEPEQGDPTVLFLGTIGPRKGIDILIDAIDNLPNSTKIWIAGEGPMRNYIEGITASDKRIEVFGRVDESMKTTLLQKSDVLVLPSRHEPWGIVVLEALACGTPVVTTSAAGVAMILEDSAVVDPEDSQQLAKAILSVVGTEPADLPTVNEMAEPLYCDRYDQ